MADSYLKCLLYLLKGINYGSSKFFLNRLKLAQVIVSVIVIIFKKCEDAVNIIFFFNDFFYFYLFIFLAHSKPYKNETNHSKLVFYIQGCNITLPNHRLGEESVHLINCIFCDFFSYCQIFDPLTHSHRPPQWNYWTTVIEIWIKT